MQCFYFVYIVFMDQEDGLVRISEPCPFRRSSASSEQGCRRILRPILIADFFILGFEGVVIVCSLRRGKGTVLLTAGRGRRRRRRVDTILRPRNHLILPVLLCLAVILGLALPRFTGVVTATSGGGFSDGAGMADGNRGTEVGTGGLPWRG